jgi:hypothetical protein
VKSAELKATIKISRWFFCKINEQCDGKGRNDVMTGFLPKLISVDLSADLVEHGDILSVTTRWQNSGTGRFHTNGKIMADFLFDETMRHLETNPDGFRLTWTAYPELHKWEPGGIQSFTGDWTVPQTWCGTFLWVSACSRKQGKPSPLSGAEV